MLLFGDSEDCLYQDSMANELDALSHAWHCIITACLRLEPGYVTRADLSGQLSVFCSSVSASVCVGVCAGPTV